MNMTLVGSGVHGGVNYELVVSLDDSGFLLSTRIEYEIIIGEPDVGGGWC